jgi:hypothetical protein
VIGEVVASVKTSSEVTYRVDLTEIEAIRLTEFLVQAMPADIRNEPGLTLAKIWQTLNSAIINRNSRHIEGE